VIRECIDDLLPHLSDGQTLILRSTVFPGVTDYVHQYLERNGKNVLVAFCPERVVQGQAIRELQDLPQIISGTTPEAEESAGRLFSAIAPKIVRMVPKEAEFAKLFCNAYRYIQFAATNQFYMLVEAAGLDYHRLLSALKEDYPRMRDLPGPGFAAGPCLYKDTLQLAAFTNNQFTLGYAALQINEELPAFLVRQLAARHSLSESTVGLLGMAFKADSDDIRASLSYKLKKLLQHQARRVLTTDPLVQEDTDLLPLDQVVNESDVLVLCVPHAVYRNLDVRGKPVLDVWNVIGAGAVTDNTDQPLGAAARQ
jgi:UDP-N-acetyl-D-mannosaminuronic acid dehydrogenase